MVLYSRTMSEFASPCVCFALAFILELAIGRGTAGRQSQLCFDDFGAEIIADHDPERTYCWWAMRHACSRVSPTVLRMTGLGRSTIYRWIADGSFPAPVRLGPRAVAWRWSDLARWTQSHDTTKH